VIVELTASRNLGIMTALCVLGCAMCLATSEFVREGKPRGEVLLFQRDRKRSVQKRLDEEANTDGEIETLARSSDKAGVEKVPNATTGLLRQSAVLHWEDVCFDIQIKGKSRRLLHQIDGWVKPGTLTALMVCFSRVQTPEHEH
jgi:ATP-binding cassette, subfamily G (WHITE), member 2, PDR